MDEKNNPLRLLEEHFGQLEDPRLDRRKAHSLLDIIGLTIVGVLCGADNWVAIETFGKAKLDFLSRYLGFANGIPSHDTLGRLFSILDAEALGKCFSSWIKTISALTQGEVVAIDGKCLRGSHDHYTGKSAIYMVNAWASANQLCLGQVKVDDKSNEITAIPKLLEMLELSGCIVTIDAMGTQKEIAQHIRQAKADYVLALKQNHAELYEEVQATFNHLLDTRYSTSDEQWDKGHGRIESRKCYALDLKAPDFDWILSEDLEQWPDLNSLIMIQAVRRKGNKIERQTRYYLSSLQLSNTTAQEMNQIVRSHWGVENQLHWTLDVAFREDHSRVRTGFADQNLAVIRRLALNLLKLDTKSKLGIQNKRLRAAWDEQYLIRILNSDF